MYTPCVVRGRELSGYIPIRGVYTPCVVTGASFPHRDCSFTEDVYAVCCHRGEDSPGIFVYIIYTPDVVSGVSFLTKGISF